MYRSFSPKVETQEATRKNTELRRHGSRVREYDSTAKHPTLVSPRIPLLTAVCDRDKDTLRHNYRQERETGENRVCALSVWCDVR